MVRSGYIADTQRPPLIEFSTRQCVYEAQSNARSSEIDELQRRTTLGALAVKDLPRIRCIYSRDHSAATEMPPDQTGNGNTKLATVPLPQQQQAGDEINIIGLY